MCWTGSNNGSPYYRRGIHPRVLGAGTFNLESSPNGIWTHKSCGTNHLAVNSKRADRSHHLTVPTNFIFLFFFRWFPDSLVTFAVFSILMLCSMFIYNGEELCTIRSVIYIYWDICWIKPHHCSMLQNPTFKFFVILLLVRDLHYTGLLQQILFYK